MNRDIEFYVGILVGGGIVLAVMLVVDAVHSRRNR